MINPEQNKPTSNSRNNDRTIYELYCPKCRTGRDKGIKKTDAVYVCSNCSILRGERVILEFRETSLEEDIYNGTVFLRNL